MRTAWIALLAAGGLVVGPARGAAQPPEGPPPVELPALDPPTGGLTSRPMGK